MTVREKNFEVISSEDLNEIKERYEKIGSNPWMWFEEDQEPPYDSAIVVVEAHNSRHISKLARLFALNGENNVGQEMAEFICKAREDIPKLIRVIEALKEKEKG